MNDDKQPLLSTDKSARKHAHSVNTARRQHHNVLLTLAALAVTGFLAACAETPVLAPAPGAVNAEGLTATATAEGLTIEATADAWPGLPSIENEVTPMKITLLNDSDRELRVRYSSFALVNESGKRFAALPPYGVTGTVDGPRLATHVTPVVRPGFHAHRFRLAVPYRVVYPTMATASDVSYVYVDPRYYAFYYPYWERIKVQLPTPEMLRRVLPEGVLDPGGELEGFLYFEYAGDQSPGTRVRFHADLVDAETSQMFASIHIPFVANPIDYAEACEGDDRHCTAAE